MRLFRSAPPPSAAAPASPEAAAPAAPDPLAGLDDIIAVCRRAAAGDLEARVVRLGDDPRLGPLALALNSVLDVVDSYVRESSAAMADCSRGRFHRPILLRGLPGAYRQGAVVINRAGLRLKENADSLALVGRLAQDNALAVNATAAACEELGATTAQISDRARSSMELAGAAVRESEDVGRGITQLSAAFQEIGEVVDLIREISGKTHLLGLNANIEAARAGQAGARFGIVAGEVRTLSTNTARATDQIQGRIESLRTSVESATALIDRLAASINRIHGAADDISRTIHEQTAATQEISRRMQEVSANTRQVSDRIAGDAAPAA